MPLTSRHQSAATLHGVVVEIDNVDATMYSSIERVDISLRQNEHDLAELVLAGISPLSVTD